MAHARDVMDKLPPRCYVVIPGGGGKIGLVKRGVTGYFAVDYPIVRLAKGTETLDDVVARLNSAEGVTPKQASAMLNGSFTGFDCPAADPDCEINEDGPPRDLA